MAVSEEVRQARLAVLAEGRKKAGRPKGIKNPSMLLSDMRKIYREAGEGKKYRGGRAVLAALLKKNPIKFMDQLGVLEKAHGGSRLADVSAKKEEEKGEGVTAEKAERDQGQERVEEMMERLLKGWEDGGS